MWLLLSFAVLIYIGYSLYPVVTCHFNGKESIATVVDKAVRDEGGIGSSPSHQVKYFTLEFDGNKVDKRFSGTHRLGEQFPVIYNPNSPEQVIRGKRADGIWVTIDLNTNDRNLIIATILVVFFLLCATKGTATKSNVPTRDPAVSASTSD